MVRVNYIKDPNVNLQKITPKISVFWIQSSVMNLSPFTEILDFGYPQNTDTGILKTFITQQGVKSQVKYILLNNCNFEYCFGFFSVWWDIIFVEGKIKKKIFVNLYHSVINPVPFGKFVVFFEYVSLDFTCHSNISKSMTFCIILDPLHETVFCHWNISIISLTE